MQSFSELLCGQNVKPCEVKSKVICHMLKWIWLLIRNSSANQPSGQQLKSNVLHSPPSDSPNSSSQFGDLTVGVTQLHYPRIQL